MRAVADGLETNKHLDILRSIGCTYWQGYLVCRPMFDSGASILNLDNEERIRSSGVFKILIMVPFIIPIKICGRFESIALFS